MGTKERLAQRLEKLARIVPGIGSYQDKEGLRDGDKRLRDTLADRLDGTRRTVEDVITKRQRDGIFHGLDRLGVMERKLHQVADTVRFATRGYSGAFDTVKIDEGKLEALYTFDISMAETVSALQQAAEGLASAPPNDKDALIGLEEKTTAFQNKLRERESLHSRILNMEQEM